MLKQLLFTCLSDSNQLQALRNKGVELRSYIKNGRTAHLYELSNFYVEVVFKFDDTEMLPEKITVFQNVEEWSNYITRRSSVE